MKLYRINAATGGRNCSIQFYNEQTGTYSKRISAGTKDKKEAETIALRWLKDGIPGRGKINKTSAIDTLLRVIEREDFKPHDATVLLEALKKKGLLDASVFVKDRDTPLFVDFVCYYWDYERSPYVKELKATGKQIGRSYCDNTLATFKKHASKAFEGLRISELNRAQIEAFLFTCSEKGLASSTLNAIRKSICQPLKYAYYKNIITQNTFDGVISFGGNARERGILTPQEVKALFSVRWDCRRCFAANLLAAQTGMRSGEVLGLQKQDIGKNYLEVRHSYSEKEGLKSTKTGKTRRIPITPHMHRLLLSFTQDTDNPNKDRPDAFVFYSFVPWHPINKKNLTDALNAALEKIGIDDNARRKRNIVFHSWRHYVATYLANNTDRRTAMGITGHETEKVFDGYSDHEDKGDFERMKNALSGLTAELTDAVQFGI